jgi:site-specific DNA-methyltransferase (adenine-specific)
VISGALYSSARGDWGTPRSLYEAAVECWGAFLLDAAASKENALCSDFCDAERDGLVTPWRSTTWCNPPYGRMVGAWVDKATDEAGGGVRSVLLLPARTDTRWWHRAMEEAYEIVLLRGRVRFVGAPAPAPFPSALIYFTGDGECRFSSMDVPR